MVSVVANGGEHGDYSSYCYGIVPSLAHYFVEGYFHLCSRNIPAHYRRIMHGPFRHSSRKVESPITFFFSANNLLFQMKYVIKVQH